MADINISSLADRRRGRPTTAGRRPSRSGTSSSFCFSPIAISSAIADDVLAKFGFGRAHHRVLHFVNRHPGMKVADLLDVLKITKQSLGRVLKQLVDQGYVVQKEGENDRRQRLLYVTPKGEALAMKLAGLQTERIARALGEIGPQRPRGGAPFSRRHDRRRRPRRGAEADRARRPRAAAAILSRRGKRWPRLRSPIRPPTTRRICWWSTTTAASAICCRAFSPPRAIASPPPTARRWRAPSSRA